LINNAGITQPVRITGIQPRDYDAVLDVNLRGMLYLSQAFIPHMISRGRGSIASTSSVSALTGGGFFGGPHYSAAKAGMLGLTKDMARELAPKGIRVNAVAPGMVDTEIRGDLMSQEVFNKILSTIPMGRIASPTEIANVFLFLASDLSSFVTGATIDVNGGMFIH
jgi:NAD(P)-dependent dehydrogenase (short-subunit alcohol dehydrogenase family)